MTWLYIVDCINTCELAIYNYISFMIYYNENKNTTVVKILIQINKYNLILQKLHVNQKKKKKNKQLMGHGIVIFISWILN